MENNKKYILEKWVKITEVFDTKEKAIETKKRYKKDKDYKDIKIFEIEELTKEIKL